MQHPREASEEEIKIVDQIIDEMYPIISKYEYTYLGNALISILSAMISQSPNSEELLKNICYAIRITSKQLVRVNKENKDNG